MKVAHMNINNKNRGFIGLPVLLAIIAVFVVAAGGTAYYLVHQNSAPQIPLHQEAITTPGPNTPRSVPGMSQYTDTVHGFSVQYPSGFVTEKLVSKEWGTDAGVSIHDAKTTSVGGINIYYQTDVNCWSPYSSISYGSGYGPISDVATTTESGIDFVSYKTEKAGYWLKTLHDGICFAVWRKEGSFDSNPWAAVLSTLKFFSAEQKADSSIPSATVDVSSLTSSSGNPVITGTFSGTSLGDIHVFVVSGVQTLPKQYQGPGSVSAVAGGPKQAYVNGQITYPGSTLSGGRYSVPVTMPGGGTLQPGTYTVGIYGGSYLLTSGTLTVNSLPDITFAPTYGATFTLAVGQSATDGPNGIRIRLESAGENITATISGKNYTEPVSEVPGAGIGSFLVANGKATTSAMDNNFAHPGVSTAILIKVVSVTGNTVTFEIDQAFPNSG